MQQNAAGHFSLYVTAQNKITSIVETLLGH